MNCTPIDQSQADSLLRKLSEDNFNKAFHVEKDRKEEKEPIWALPPEERLYYVVSVGKDDVLLAGISVKNLNLSSFAKLTEDDQFRGYGRKCLKKLIEDALVPLCKKENRTSFSAVFVSDEGYVALRYLLKNRPSGIADISCGIICRFHIE